MTHLRPLDLARLRSQIPPLEVLRRWGWRGHWTPSDQYRGPCPIHGSRSPRSRSLSVGAELVFCHSCGWWGDAVELWAWRHHWPVLVAAYDLCRTLGIPPPVLRQR